MELLITKKLNVPPNPEHTNLLLKITQLAITQCSKFPKTKKSESVKRFVHLRTDLWMKIQTANALKSDLIIGTDPAKM